MRDEGGLDLVVTGDLERSKCIRKIFRESEVRDERWGV